MKEVVDKSGNVVRTGKVRRSGFGCASLLVACIALVFLFLFWPVGILLFVVAAVLERPKWLCGYCGNRVERESRLCPTCKVQLD